MNENIFMLPRKIKKNLKESDKKIEENFCLYWGTLLAREERLFSAF